MSSKTYATPVPFKIIVWTGTTGASTIYPSLHKFFYHIEYVEYEYAGGVKREEPKPDFEEAGWKLIGFGEYGELLTSVLKKGDCLVHYVNESQYAAGGANITCFFSSDRHSLELFCDDWGFDKSMIQTGKAAQQTL